MLRGVGFSFIFVGAIVLLGRGAAGNLVVASLSEAASSDAAVTAVFEIGTSLLLEMGQSLVAYGLVIVVAAWLAGPTGVATSIRRAITPRLRQPAYAYGGSRGAADAAVLVGPGDRHAPAWSRRCILVALAVLGTEMLRRQVIREFPDRVTTGSPAGIAQDSPSACERDASSASPQRVGPWLQREAIRASTRSSGWPGCANPEH